MNFLFSRSVAHLVSLGLLRAAAGSLAVVNCIGSLSGFARLALVGAVKQALGGMQVPVLVISLVTMARIFPLALALRKVKG